MLVLGLALLFTKIRQKQQEVCSFMSFSSQDQLYGMDVNPQVSPPVGIKSNGARTVQLTPMKWNQFMLDEDAVHQIRMNPYSRTKSISSQNCPHDEIQMHPSPHTACITHHRSRGGSANPSTPICHSIAVTALRLAINFALN